MKRVLIVLFVLFTMVSGSFAQETPVDIFIDPKGDFGPDNRAPALLPSVTYEDNNVFIYAPYTIESMEVVIYDATGEAVYTYTSAMVASKNTIILPTAVSEEKFAIELSYGSFCLVGYF